MSIKTRAIIEAGAEFRLPAGFFQGLTLESVSGPAFEITEDAQSVSIGHTFGGGVVVIRRAADGNSDDSAFVLDEPGGTGGGEAGRGIATITVSAGKLTGTYTDGTKWDAGTLPVGPAGPQGPKGDTGTAATVQVGIVTTLAAGAEATVTNRGTGSAAVLDFGIPKGADGTGGSGGGGLDTEAVQDIVGAMVKAGNNTYVTYDDAVGALTISAVSGSAANTPVYLSAGNAVGLRTPPTVATIGEPAYLLAAVWEMTPEVDCTFQGLRDLAVLGPAQYQAVVWQKGVVTAPLATGSIITGGSSSSSIFSSPLPLMGGTPYLIGWQGVAGRSHPIRVASTAPTYARIALGPQQYGNDPGGYPNQNANWGSSFPGFELLTNEPKKSTLNPLDPVDFPRSTPATAANNSGFMVVDDAAKTASLYWKFSDGSTKKVDLT